MSSRAKAKELYRRDEKAGGKLLSPEERLKLIEPYLPPIKVDQEKAERTRGRRPSFGIRRFFEAQLHVLVFTVIHAIFSIYIRSRQAYHAVRDRIYSIFYYHHRDPAMIQKDVKRLSKLPRILSVILKLEDDGKGGSELERLVNEVAETSAWCACAGIPVLNVYEKTGLLKQYLPEIHRAISQNLKSYFGKQHPTLALCAPHQESIESPASGTGYDGEGPGHLLVRLVSYEDGRDSIVDLTKTLAEMAQKNKVDPAHIDTNLLDEELKESVMEESDLLIIFGPYVEFQGYPPWHLHITEVFHVPDNEGVGYQVFYSEHTSASQPDDIMSFVRPPVLKPSAILNKAAFNKTLNLAAATVRDNKNITRLRQTLTKSADALLLDRISTVVANPDPALAAKGGKALLLKPTISPAKQETWGPVVSELVKQDEVSIVPYQLQLDYDYWSYRDVMTAQLPPELHDDIPAGFNTAGHVAHLNLRDQHLPYKQLIGQVLVEKNPNIRTVINKVDNVGTESEFRTFSYEVLAGPDDLNVELNENGCLFKFDYSKVYWNSKLEKEHTRLIRLFKPGEVVCDVMAGIGPFAVPAGKRGVFVWANDYNPESFKYLKDAITKNKVGTLSHLLGLDVDANSKLRSPHMCDHSTQTVFSRSDPKGKRPPPTVIPIPATVSHFVMNLPASATEFLPNFRGVYAGHEQLFEPHTRTKLPVVHVHCFALKSDGDEPRIDVADRVSKELGTTLVWDGVKDTPSGSAGQGEIKDGEVAVHLVRDVAPSKSMYCASLRVPADVAFAARS
ncbi:Met-10+ like-protein-domain-containing protein [Coniella lustricola]|uniref:tRNA (guanine(37)-N1)-methyltransferase n=1 Tax=Coniella lustricola TaxID=2025994 RepID=A0A2T3ACX6_9PEZI|nr:Met-10+ like-protein-domain-containing protein [Coniella lustricola]